MINFNSKPLQLFFLYLGIVALIVFGCQKEPVSPETASTTSSIVDLTSTDDRSCTNPTPCPTLTQIQAASSNVENKADIIEADVACWKSFEAAVCCDIPSPKAFQVSLDVVANGVTYRIVADYLQKVGTKYQIIDAKTSKYVELADLCSLLSKCTPNQKVVYPLINNGTVTTAKIAGSNAGTTGPGSTAVASNLGLTSGQTIDLVNNVKFYVNKPRTSCTNWVVRNLTKPQPCN